MKYQNPVISGFNPDPSICRVGEDYYLVTSSFEYFPGLPLYHSRDLVNWKQINNCLQRPEEFPLSHVKDSGGVWAPTIRFYGGRFYVTATLEQYGNFIVSAKEPAGEWSAPVWVPVGGIDPSLFFEEGKAYYCTNYSLHPGREEITLEEIEIQTGELLTEPEDFDCEMQTRFHFHTCREGDEAGIVVMLSSLFHYRMFLKRVEGRDYLMLEKCAEDIRQQVFCQEVRLEDDTDIRMEVRADKEKYSFYFSVENASYEYAGSGSTRFLCVEIAGKCFTGTVMGLYTCCEQETEAVLQVREWRMQ